MGKRELRARLYKAGIRLNEAAETLFADPRFVTSPVEYALPCVEVSVADLGMSEGARFAAIVERAAGMGLALCPIEIGPHLRLQFTDQPEGSIGRPGTSQCAPPGSVTVASAPLADDDETPKGFYLRRIEGVLWLRGFRASPDHRYAPDDVFVFRDAGRRA